MPVLLRILLITVVALGLPGQASAGQRRSVAKKASPSTPAYRARAARPARRSIRIHRGRSPRPTTLRAAKKSKTLSLAKQSRAPMAIKSAELGAQKSKGSARPASLKVKAKARAKAKGNAKQNRFLKHRDKVRAFQEEFVGDREAVLANQGADGHVAKVMRHSERNGQYHIVSDLHWGKGRLGKAKRADWDPREDFRRSESFAKFVGQISRSKRGVSLVIGGDWLELMEHVDANAPIAEVKDQITRIVEGHAIETKALAKAVTDQGMRLIYLAGNHDVHLVDSRVRDHLIAEIGRVGNVPANKRARLQQRVAYSGHGAVLGRFGEGMVVHGHVQDASNNWRSVLNPYNAKRQLQSNLGWNIVARLYRRIEQRNPDIDNIGKSSTKAVAKKVFTSPRHIVSAIKIVWNLLGGTRHYGKAGKFSEALDDRQTMRAWEKRTGFADKMSTAIPGATPSPTRSFTKTIESIYQGAPKPLHEAMKTRSRTVNFLVSLATAWMSVKKTKSAEPTLLSRMTGELTNVRYVVWGHNHKEAVVTGESAKGALAHYNTGTWTKVEGEWRLNVVSGHTNGDGRLTMDGVFRTELASGKPNLSNHYDAAEARSVPGWNN